ncbi:MAG: c-type cytochrome [Pseudomonadota bacterium]
MSDNTPDKNSKDPLFLNKIFGAVLAAALLFFGLPQLSKALFGGGHHGGDGELHLAYCCVELDFGEAAAADAGETVYDLGALLADASVAAGERGSALCASCHSFDQGGANGTGPNLWNIVGRDVASVSGFNYSNALASLSGAWTYERLDKYLENSQEYVPGTSMAQRVSRDNKRAEILAYLGSLSNNPVAYPDPIPAPVEEASAAAADSE